MTNTNVTGTYSYEETGLKFQPPVVVALNPDGTPLSGSGSGGDAAQGPGTNKSGTITAANTSQVIAAQNSARRSLSIVNISETETLWVSEHGAATTGPGSVPIKPNGSCRVMSSNAVTVRGAVAGQPFTATEV